MKHFHLRSITAILFIFLTFFSVATIFITPSLSFTSSLSNTNSYPIGNAFGLDHIGPNDAPRVAEDGRRFPAMISIGVGQNKLLESLISPVIKNTFRALKLIIYPQILR